MMLYNILAPYAGQLHIANLFTYISFRTGLSIICSMLICIFFTPCLISGLRKLQANGQPIRDDGPESHKNKAGTPTMGGLIILAATAISTLLFSDLSNPYIWICLFVLLVFGLLGFADDYKKVKKNNSKGVSGKMKLLVQFLVSVVVFMVVQNYVKPEYASALAFPFFKNFFIDLGYFYIPFVMVVIIGSSNAVNLTDGLDGLAIGAVAIAVASFGLIAYLVGNSIYANYLQIIHVQRVGELTVLCGAIVGSALGFLWYNAQPAEIFMGDTGSLSLGGVLGTISVITKHELVLVIIGGVFVMETLSVIIQVYYFKVTGGKRYFLMAPIHHHFEKKGWPESKVVLRFYIIAIIFALIGLASLKLR